MNELIKMATKNAPKEKTHFSIWDNEKGVTFYKDLNTDNPMFSHVINDYEWRNTNFEIFNENRIYDLSSWNNLVETLTPSLWDGKGIPKIGEQLYYEATKVTVLNIAGSSLVFIEPSGEVYVSSSLYNNPELSPINPSVEELCENFNINIETAEQLINAGYRKSFTDK